MPIRRTALWPLRLLVGTSLSTLLLVAGCVPATTTLAQDLAAQRWQRCNHFPGVELTGIQPDGQIWVRYRGERTLEQWRECLRQAEAEQGMKTAVVKAPEPVGTPSPQPPGEEPSVARSPFSAPVWKRGYEWAYKWESPRGNGTFVWSVDREEVVDGTEYYVVKTGSREIYERKADLAWHMDKVEGAVEARSVPPRMWITWPLSLGKSWEQSYDRQRPLDRTTEGIVMACGVEAEETITVPAGTFRTLKIVCRRGRTGGIIDEVWYSPEVKHWVRERGHFSYGIRERELTAFKIR